jgi:hypothetical protein
MNDGIAPSFGPEGTEPGGNMVNMYGLTRAIVFTIRSQQTGCNGMTHLCPLEAQAIRYVLYEN